MYLQICIVWRMGAHLIMEELSFSGMVNGEQYVTMILAR